MHTIAGEIAKEHEVHIYASRPSYRGSKSAPKHEMLDGLNVKRCWVFNENRRNPLLRVLNVLLYCFGLFFRVLRLRPDVVTASTFPPVIAAWSASLAAKFIGAKFIGAKFIYHMQDIHPEVSKFSGGRLGRGLPFKLLRWLDNQTLRRATAIVVLSKDMANTLGARGLGPLPIHIINNFLLTAFGGAEAAPEEYKKAEGKTRVIFAGNLGRYQNLDLLTDGVAGCFEAHPELELFLLGDGAALPGLKAKWGSHPQVSFAPFLPFSQASSLIEGADIGLVSLAPDIYRVAYPSKILTYLGLGVPVLALIEPESELAREVETNGLGMVPTKATADSIALSLEQMLSNPDIRKPVASWYSLNASAEIILKKWKLEIEGLDLEKNDGHRT